MSDYYAEGSVMDTAVSNVSEQIARLNEMASDYQAQLGDALVGISDAAVFTTPEAPSITAPILTAPTFSMTASAPMSLPDIDLGSVDINLPSMPEAGTSSVDIPAAPTLPTINVPAPPGMSTIALPQSPAIDTAITMPSAPNLVLPEMEALDAITLPAFTYPDLPTFDGTPPDPDSIKAPGVFLNWHEPEYRSEVLDEILPQVRAMLQGGTGIPPVVEEALFARTRERERAETEREIQAATDTWAARGFSMPPGMLAKQAAVLREQGRLQAAELNRDIMVQAATWEIENLRFAVQQGIALEQLTQNLFGNMVQRLFEAARFQVESEITVFNAHVGLFNAKNQAFATYADAYRIKLEHALGKLQAYKTAVDAQVAAGQINQQRVEVFKGKVDAVLAHVEIYKAMVQGEAAKTEVIKGQFDAYRAEVAAYGEQISAEKVKFDAYAAQVQGVTAQANVFEAQARAYASRVQGAVAQADVQAKNAQIRIESIRAQAQVAEAQVGAYKAKADFAMTKISRALAAIQAQSEAARAQANADAAIAEATSRISDMASRTQIAYGEALVARYQAASSASIQKAGIAVEAAKAIGQYSAQLAAGAMSAAHVSASISASGSGSSSYSRSESTSTSHNYNY